MNLVQTMPDKRFRRSLPSQLSAVDECCQDVEQMLSGEGLSAHVFAVGLLLREALTNAVVHGNRQDPAKSIHVDVYCGKRWITLHIRDEGEGFDWKARRRHRVGEEETGGRGLSIYRLYAERVMFNASGNAISLRRSRKEE
jgi:serine/threonine-protein kinase RsbW